MKFKVERRDLIEALEPVSRLAKKLSSMEMLAHVKLEAYERLAVKATNLDTSESRVLDAEIEEAGQCTADTKKLLGLLKADRSDTVSFETASSEWIQLTTDGMSVKIRTLDAEQYPVFDENLKFWFDTAQECCSLTLPASSMLPTAVRDQSSFWKPLFWKRRAERFSSPPLIVRSYSGLTGRWLHRK